MSKRKGFTLIELLVVIAIIAVLMAILMPALQRAKKQVWGILCRSNLKQYTLSSRMYLDDHDGQFPYSFSWLYSRNWSGCRWHDEENNLTNKPEEAGSLWPYLKDKDIHVCPEFAVVTKMMGCRNCDDITTPIEPQYSYCMNSYLNGDAWGAIPSQYRTNMENVRNESQVVNPARVFFFSEENSWAIPGLSNASINDNNLRALPNGSTDCFATYHRAPSRDLNMGYANASFVDGHVEEVSANPNPNTFILSWPSGAPIPDF
ncbi:MAG: type II secretion system protein [Planctomycetota bacterium]|jgi:prepilin-type N-terminal cleavage/methylation domain-containing protein/prepilin-type processing-associated H-X9-DG protein